MSAGQGLSATMREPRRGAARPVRVTVRRRRHGFRGAPRFALTALLVTLPAGLTIPIPARAEIVTKTLTADADNTLWEDPAGELSDGQGCFITVGRSGRSPGRRRGLLRFGSIANSIPSGAAIRRVTLRIDVAELSRLASRRTISLHRLTRAWGEISSGAECTSEAPSLPEGAVPGDATWLHTHYPGPCPDGCWQTPGGDFVATASAFAVVGTIGRLELSSSVKPDDLMAVDVGAWRDDRESNFGWILIGNEADTSTVARLSSRERDEAKRPQLIVDYELGGPAEEPRACCFEDRPCDLLVPSECIARGGHPSGASQCTPDPCPRPCCIGLRCAEMDSAECAAQHGTPGPGLGCATTACSLTPFVDPLPILPVAVPEAGIQGGQARYRIPMTQFKHKFHRDLDSTVVWGYQGMIPGPTIEAARDVPVTVQWINDLRNTQGELRTGHHLPVDPCVHGAHMTGPPPTVVHLHGAHITPKYDGNPDSSFIPGEGREYVYPNHQLPATLWYHDHALGITRLNVMMGLAGLYLIRDESEPRLGLPPREYEIPLLIQDRSFRSDGLIQYPESWQPEFFGDYAVVNGKVSPFLSVRAGMYRLRLLNASNFRGYRLELSSGDRFHVIGTEGGFLSAPVAVEALNLMPAERADVLIDFSGRPGQEIILRNSADPDHPLPDIMKFIVGTEPGYAGPLPASLAPLPPISEAGADTTRDFTISLGPEMDECGRFKFLFNHVGYEDIRDYPRLGSTEVWTFRNCTPFTHPVHVHLVMFRVLDRQPFTGSCEAPAVLGPRIPPDPSELGWKDTAPVGPNEILRLLVPFRDYPGVFPFHCHMLEHEDNELMRQFQVVDRPVNHAPDASRAAASAAVLWPPDERMAPVWITGASDADGDPVTITVTAVTQDEPLWGKREHEKDEEEDEEDDGARPIREEPGITGEAGGRSETDVASEAGARVPKAPDSRCSDARIDGGGLVYLRRERLAPGNGRVYAISFTATDGRGGSSDGVVTVCVPRHRHARTCKDDGQSVNSLGPCKGGRKPVASRDVTALTVGAPRLSGREAIIEYVLPEESDVLLTVFDIAGRQVATLERSRRAAGRHQVSWNTATVPSGIYFARVRTGDSQATRSILLFR